MVGRLLLVDGAYVGAIVLLLGFRFFHEWFLLWRGRDRANIRYQYEDGYRLIAVLVVMLTILLFAFALVTLLAWIIGG
jgi:hypothetical protein